MGGLKTIEREIDMKSRSDLWIKDVMARHACQTYISAKKRPVIEPLTDDERHQLVIYGILIAAIIMTSGAYIALSILDVLIK